jgi:hypothetical protein
VEEREREVVARERENEGGGAPRVGGGAWARAQGWVGSCHGPRRADYPLLALACF